MKITKRQLRRIIREAVTAEDEKRSREYWATAQGRETAKSLTTPDADPAAMGPPQWMGATEDKSVEVWEAVQQNVEEPSFAKWLGEELGSGPDPEYIMDALQQNLNNQDFVVWLYGELGLGV